MSQYSSPILTVSSSDVNVVNLRKSSQPEETDTVDFLVFDRASDARFMSAVRPAMVPARKERRENSLIKVRRDKGRKKRGEKDIGFEVYLWCNSTFNRL